MEQEGRIGGASMTISEPSTRALREAIAALEPNRWLRDDIIEALDEASKAVSIVSFYQRYFNRLILAFDNPEDAELVDFLSSRMRESEEVVNAHVESQRDHLRHTIHDFLLDYLFLNATSYFHPIAEAFARRVGYRGDPMSCLNYTYFLAAHFHDLGYPVQFHQYLLEFVRQVASDFPHVIHMERSSLMRYGSDAPLTSLFAWRAGLYGDAEGSEGNISTLPARAVREQVDIPDHALTAAFLLWDRATEHESGPSSGERFTAPVLRTAALACASHNFQYLVRHSKWYRISLARDPASFLLQLVDEIQDWSRERIDVDLLGDIGREVEKHRRRETLDWFLRSSRTFQWLQHPGGSDVGITGEDGARLPIEEVDEVLAKESGTVRPEHLGLVRELAVRSLFHHKLEFPPQTEEEAKTWVDMALRYRDLGEKDYFASHPTIPARWWAMYRHHMLLTGAYVSSRPYPELYDRMQFWRDWEDRRKEGKCWIENAQVGEPVRDYGLAIWTLDRARVDLASLWNEPVTGPADGKRIINRFEEAIQLAKRAFLHRRRAIEWGTGKAIDGYETLAQGLADQASGYDVVIRDCWEVLEKKLKEDPRGVVIRMTVEFEREIRALWERARRVLRPKETLARFYARCARTAAYAASIQRYLRSRERASLSGNSP